MLPTPMVVTLMVVWFSCGLLTYIGARRHSTEQSSLQDSFESWDLLLSDWPISPF